MSTEVIKRENVLLRICKLVWTEYSIALVLVFIFVLAGIIAPRFFTASNILIILRQASIIGMIALGMTFVIIIGGIDLSSGHSVAAAGAALIVLQGNENVPMFVAILASFALATFIGFANGIFVTKFRLPPFIVTLAIGIMARSIALNQLGGQSLSGRRVPEFTNIGLGSVGVIPNALIVWIVFTIIFACILKYTKFGASLYAVGGNEVAAKYSGIAVNKVKLLAFTIAGFCVGVATLLDLSRMAAVAPATTGDMYEFDAITAVVVGGTSLAGGKGRILNTVFGVIIIQSISNIMIMFGLSPFLNGMLRGAIILIAVLLQRRDKAV